jgi:hypothetical protein
MLQGIFRKCAKRIDLPGDGLNYIRLIPGKRKESLYAIGPKDGCNKIAADLKVQSRVVPLASVDGVWGLLVRAEHRE